MRSASFYLFACLLSSSCVRCKSESCHCPPPASPAMEAGSAANRGGQQAVLAQPPKPVEHRVEAPACPAGWKAPEKTAQTHRFPGVFPPFPWKVQAIYKAHARITAQPVHLGDGRWVVADHRGRVRMLEISRTAGGFSLREVWKAQLPDVVWSAPMVSEDGRFLWVGCDDDFVYRIAAADGTVAQQVKPFACAYTRRNDPEATRCDMDAGFAPLPDGGVLAAGAGVARLLADAQVQWRFPVGTHVRGAPVQDDSGSVYFSTLGGEIISLDVNGNLRWRERARARCDASPLLAPGCRLIVGCDDHTLNAYSTLDGHPEWRLHVPGEFRGAGALSPDGSVVYWGSLDRHLYAVETATGRVRWRYRTSGRHLGAPWVDSSGNVLVFPEENRGYWLGPDGVLLGTLDLPAIADAPPAFIDSRTVLLALETGDILLMGSAE